MTFTQSILFASGVISALLVTATYQTPVTSRTAQSQSVLLAQATTDQLPQLPQSGLANTFIPADASLGRTPMMMMPIDEGRVSVSLENATAAPLIYQALGDTEPRTLAAGSDSGR
ncbi:hypothetical protein S7335_1445 [Synechococcus sp. PCC 7335]|uniref:hypothetical protein n=1 Tax=Synechococcus sp. (strain ATCC 29403 / PCC 7335) TaxID=91464 RepID=UPI00017ECEBC|nr:hypothetical protein [Synechococcus sp. PCC 7335]EDX83748.1 hypothetical protein S7335_1445 [Synechococcus sp. PCC 7335]